MEGNWDKEELLDFYLLLLILYLLIFPSITIYLLPLFCSLLCLAHDLTISRHFMNACLTKEWILSDCILWFWLPLPWIGSTLSWPHRIWCGRKHPLNWWLLLQGGSALVLVSPADGTFTFCVQLFHTSSQKPLSQEEFLPSYARSSLWDSVGENRWGKEDGEFLPHDS